MSKDPLGDIVEEIADGKPPVTETVEVKVEPVSGSDPVTGSESPKPEPSVWKDSEGVEWPDFDPNKHRLKGGKPVLNKNPKRHGKYAKKSPGRYGGKAKGAQQPPPKPTAPEFNEPGSIPEGPPPPPPDPYAEHRACAEKIVGIEQTAALLTFKTPAWKFTDEEVEELIKGWTEGFKRHGVINLPWWFDLALAHAMILQARISEPNTLEKLQGWAMWGVRLFRRLKGGVARRFGGGDGEKRGVFGRFRVGKD